MLTREDIELTKKYMDDYGKFCASRECGQGCPVYDIHETEKQTSCFKIYCRLRESGTLEKPV